MMWHAFTMEIRPLRMFNLSAAGDLQFQGLILIPVGLQLFRSIVTISIFFSLLSSDYWPVNQLLHLASCWHLDNGSPQKVSAVY